jgi:hypothetical protein
MKSVIGITWHEFVIYENEENPVTYHHLQVDELLRWCTRESSVISKDWGVSAANLSLLLFRLYIY